MTQLIHLIADTYIGCEIPDKVAQISIDPTFNVLYCWSYEGVETTIPLPPGNWQLICTTKECTEELAKGIIQALPAGRKTFYKGLKDDREYWYKEAQEALISLLTSKGLDVNKNYVLIKKIS